MICLVMDGLLLLYGIILTVLYCRLRKYTPRNHLKHLEKKPADAAIYTGLSFQTRDTYETIHDKKKPVN